MATVTVYTAERMKQIEDETVVGATIVGNNLYLTQRNGVQINVGPILVLTAPNGTKYRLTVSNDGVLSAVLA